MAPNPPNSSSLEQLVLKGLIVNLGAGSKPDFSVHFSFSSNWGQRETGFKGSTVSTTGGHVYKLYKPHCTETVRQIFFVGFACCSVWNSLPCTSLDFSSPPAFKSSIQNVDFSIVLCGTVFNITRCHCCCYYSLSYQFISLLVQLIQSISSVFHGCQ